MKGAVIYARYSSERQNEQSIEGQLRICNQYAEANGGELYFQVQHFNKKKSSYKNCCIMKLAKK